MAESVLLFDLYLVRHGQSEGNAGTSASDSPQTRQDSVLSEQGFLQARLLSRRFADIPLDAVFSSGLRRALLTAGEVVKRQPEDGAHQVEVLPLMTECGVGEQYTGFPFAQLQQLVPAAVPALDQAIIHTVLPNTEPEDDAYNIERARETLAYFRARFHSGEKVMAVAHGVFNTLLLLCALGIDTQRFDPDYDNTSVTLLSFFADGTGPWGFDVRLRSLNDTSHLLTHTFFTKEENHD